MASLNNCIDMEHICTPQQLFFLVYTNPMRSRSTWQSAPGTIPTSLRQSSFNLCESQRTIRSSSTRCSQVTILDTIGLCLHKVISTYQQGGKYTPS
eukprot:394285-Amphidinium_carterae.1